MSKTTEWIHSAQVGRDGWRRMPGFAGIFARNYHGGFEHFSPGGIVSATSYAGWTVTQITAVGPGTLAMADEAGGVLTLNGGATDGDGVQMQAGGECFLPAANKDIYIEARLKIQDADDLDWFFGLACTDTNIFSTQPTELIAFLGDDGDANLDFQVRNGGAGAQADTAVDMANDTYKYLGFHVVGVTKVVPYIDGVAQTAVTANMPTALMRLTMGMLNGATTANQLLSLDWISWIQFL